VLQVWERERERERERGAYRVLVGNPEEKRPIGRPRPKWEDNIKMELEEVGWGARTALLCVRIGTGRGLF
jgi:hypothetical protein